MRPNDVKAAAAGRWRDVARQLGIANEFLSGQHGPCPKCSGTDRWRVFEDFDQSGGAICNQCGQHLADGFALTRWWLGCDFRIAVERVADLVGIQTTGNGRPRIVETYPYTDEAGELLFEVCRYEPKNFRQRRPDGKGGWVWSTKGARRVPFHLPELLGRPDYPVFICEGEKDVLALESLGFLATTNAGGAGKWTAEHSRFLASRDVVIVPDDDKPGRQHAEQVARSLQGIARSVRIVELPGLADKGDVSDWISAGGTLDDLVDLAQAAPEWTQAQTPVTTHEDSTESTLLRPEGRTEAANARRFVDRHGDDIRWCDPWGKWLAWDGQRWKVDDRRRVEALAMCIADGLWEAAAAIARSGDVGPKEFRPVEQFAATSNHANGIRNMQALARCDVAILPEALDKHPWLFNCMNGTLDLRTGTLRPRNKADYVTQLCPVPYEPDARFPTWLAFLETVMAGDRELICYVQRLVGYCLTGSTREHLLPFLHGVGANGKSTFVSTVLAMLGPDFGMKAPTDLLLTKRDTHPTERADLYAKRFVVCVEAEDGRRLAESLVKELTGGDRVRARRMREDFWEFSATHKIWLAANHKPTVRGTDHGIWRRIKLLPFTVVIPDGEQDKDLPAKLLDELPGILAWAVEGCRQWQQDGLREPDCVRAATGAYRDEMDLVGRFVAECCVVEPDASVGATAIYTRFKAWCDSAGERCVNQTRFGGRLTERGFASEKVGGGRVIRHGIGLPEGAEEHDSEV